MSSYLTGLPDPRALDIQVDLSKNESRLGPPTSAREAYKAAAAAAWTYPDGSQCSLRRAIAKRFGLPTKRIVCGAGADELISLIFRAFTSPGAEVLIPDHSFIMFEINAALTGSTVVKAPCLEWRPQVDEILSRLTERTRLVLIANPNNPTGVVVGREGIETLARSIPDSVTLVIDSVYSEYVFDEDYVDGHDLVEKFPNVLVLRSFSKIYGLAGLRVGWCHASESAVARIDRFRNPYNISAPAMSAAEAALHDREHERQVRLHNATWRDRLAVSLRNCGFAVGAGHANFVFVNAHDNDNAHAVHTHLLANGILTRRLLDYGLGACLRITVGTAADNAMLLSALSTLPKDVE